MYDLEHGAWWPGVLVERLHGRMGLEGGVPGGHLGEEGCLPQNIKLGAVVVVVANM